MEDERNYGRVVRIAYRATCILPCFYGITSIESSYQRPHRLPQHRPRPPPRPRPRSQRDHVHLQTTHHHPHLLLLFPPIPILPRKQRFQPLLLVRVLSECHGSSSYPHASLLDEHDDDLSARACYGERQSDRSVLGISSLSTVIDTSLLTLHTTITDRQWTFLPLAYSLHFVLYPLFNVNGAPFIHNLPRLVLMYTLMVSPCCFVHGT
jgi:hypothetical protein